MEILGRFRNGNLERELTALQSKMDQKMGELEVRFSLELDFI